MVILTTIIRKDVIFNVVNRLFLSIVSVCLSTVFLIGQVPSLEKGKVVDTVRVTNSEDESYSLYVPNAYDPDKLSAIVFIFDPVARGGVGIAPFIKAAEQYNYLLVCSNDSRNGPYERNFDIANRLFDQVFNTFQIDAKQVYTAGFSGGARLATAIAVLTDQIQGVIGCGAGFSSNTDHTPNFEKFSYVGLVGVRDMNYQEMVNNIKWLRRFKVENELFVSKDDHRWPNPDQILTAFDWLELQAYKRELRLKDTSTISHLYQKNLDAAYALEAQSELLNTVKEYERIIRNFAPYLDMEAHGKKIKELKRTQGYRREQRSVEEVKYLEIDITKKFRGRFMEELQSPDPEQDFTWWEREVQNFDKRYMENKNPRLREMGERIRSSLFAIAFESGNGYKAANDMPKLLYCNEVLLVLSPTRPFPQYRMAQYYAQMGDEEKFLEHLEAAMKLGFTDKEQLLRTPEFSGFLETEAFKELMDRY